MLFLSCDRFDNTFPVKISEDVLIAEFILDFNEKATGYLRANEIDDVLSYFSEDYLNSGFTVSDLIDFFFSVAEWSSEAQIEAKAIIGSGNRRAFNLSVTDNTDVDSTWVDYVAKIGDQYKWVGNRQLIAVEEFLVFFQEEATNYLRDNDIDNVLCFFSDDYLNSGITKDDLADFFNSISWSPEAIIEVSSARNRNTSYTISVLDAVSDVDSTWVDYVEYTNEQFLWVGNKQTMIELVVLAQSFTALSCRFCPDASGRLHEIESIYPDNFIFIDYHNGDSLSVYNNFAEEVTYYRDSIGQLNMPTVVFQGQTIIRGAGSNINRYLPTVQTLLAVEPEIGIQIIEHSVVNRDITGSVKIVFNPDKPPTSSDNLYLYYLVYQREVPGAIYQYDTSKTASRVVRARGSVPIVSLESDQVIQFSLASTKHLTQDTFLLVWVQKIADIGTWSADDKILNAVRKPLF
jgi:hypothetical protein